MNKKSLKEKIVDFVCNISSQPIRYKDLLISNALFNEGMLVDPAKLNFRINIKKTYFVYAIICFCIIAPIVLISHFAFKDINTHVSMAGVIVITSCVLIGYNYFIYWIRKAITSKLIQKAWLVHFPYFSYKKYSKEVERLYNEIIKQELPRKDWEQYILDGLL